MEELPFEHYHLEMYSYHRGDRLPMPKPKRLENFPNEMRHSGSTNICTRPVQENRIYLVYTTDDTMANVGIYLGSGRRKRLMIWARATFGCQRCAYNGLRVLNSWRILAGSLKRGMHLIGSPLRRRKSISASSRSRSLGIEGDIQDNMCIVVEQPYYGLCNVLLNRDFVSESLHRYSITSDNTLIKHHGGEGKGERKYGQNDVWIS